MKDFRIMSAKVRLNVYSMAPVRGFSPPSIVVVGEKMGLAEEVLFNGTLSPAFVIQSPTRLLVQIPPSEVGRELRDLAVQTSTKLSHADADVTLGLTRPLRMVEGIERLIQSWIIIFLSSPTSSIFAPGSGGGALELIGKTTDRGHRSVSADLALKIDRTKTELLRLQAGKNIPASERLLSSDLQKIEFDPTTQTVSALISLKNSEGTEASVTLG